MSRRSPRVRFGAGRASRARQRRRVAGKGRRSTIIGVNTTCNPAVGDLAALLQTQHAAKLDVVTTARDLVADNRRLRLIGVGNYQLTADGVAVGETVLRPTAVADAGTAEKLGIPLPHLRRLRADQVVLDDANVNIWLADDPDRRSANGADVGVPLGGAGRPGPVRVGCPRQPVVAGPEDRAVHPGPVSYGATARTQRDQRAADRRRCPRPGRSADGDDSG